MYSDMWWSSYEEWASETARHHNLLAGLVLGMADTDGTFSGPDLMVDLGCGRLRMARELFGPCVYVGVDLDHGAGTRSYPDFKSFEACVVGTGVDEGWDGLYLRKDMSDVDFEAMRRFYERRGFARGMRTWVTSLFSAELYLERPEELYGRALESGVDLVVSAGVRYLGTDVHKPIGEPGSEVFQTPADVDVGHLWWDEVRFVRKVPSSMFGPSVQEVWRVMWRGGYEWVG